jgi:hypothetical protein
LISSKRQKSNDSLPQPPGLQKSENEHHHHSYFNRKAKFSEGITSKFDKNALRHIRALDGKDLNFLSSTEIKT